METRNSNTWIIAVLALAVGFLVAWLIWGTGNDNNNTSATVSGTAATTTSTAASTPGTSTTTTNAGTGTSVTSSTTTAPSAAPSNPQATTASCIALWNQPNNRGDQVFLVNQASRQPVRIHVGATSDVPPKCLITVIGNNGDAYVFPEAGGTTYPYAQAPGSTPASSLPAAQKVSNALNQSDGTLKAR